MESSTAVRFSRDGLFRVEVTPANMSGGKFYGADWEIKEQSFGEESGWFTHYSGHLKWDGCNNWSTTDGYAAHDCDHEHFMKVAACFAEIRRLAARLLPDMYEDDVPTHGEDYFQSEEPKP